MESSVFELQCQLIEKWDNEYTLKYKGKSKNERLQFFKLLNQDLSFFYHKYIDYNIWQVQRAYFFAFWLGIMYLKNSDCIKEIEKILNFSNIYCPFAKIVAMQNNKVRRIILNGDYSESKIIFEKMNHFTNKYQKFEDKINTIIRFYRVCKRWKTFKRNCTSIAIFRKILPDEIVLQITSFICLDIENEYKISYLKNKREIDMIIEQCGLNSASIKYVIDLFFKNNKSIINTIIEIINRDF